MHRAARAAAVALATAGLAAGLSGCGGGSADALARQACVHVTRSIQLFTRSQSTADASTAARQRSEAYAQLRTALPLAARANTDSGGQWVALVTTLSETSRVDESNLVPALRAQCAVARSGNPDLPPAPTPPSRPSP